MAPGRRQQGTSIPSYHRSVDELQTSNNYETSKPDAYTEITIMLHLHTCSMSLFVDDIGFEAPGLIAT